jgi:hypothetical protein
VNSPRPSLHLILTAVALSIAMIGFLVGRGTANVNDSLVRLVRDLSESAGPSTTVAAAVLAGSCILAALIVPAVVVAAAIYADRREERQVRQCRRVYPEGLPPNQNCLDTPEDTHRGLPSPSGHLSCGRPADHRRGRPGPPASPRTHRRRRRSRHRAKRRRAPDGHGLRSRQAE